MTAREEPQAPNVASTVQRRRSEAGTGSASGSARTIGAGSAGGTAAGGGTIGFGIRTASDGVLRVWPFMYSTFSP